MKFISFLLLSFTFFLATSGFTQIKSSSKAYIKFHSEIGGIYAENTLVKSTLNTSTGALSFSLDIQNFIFKNSLMQKHYNEEDMMHSEKFPTAVFTGEIVDNKAVNFTKSGSYPVIVKGKITIKGVSQIIEAKGIISVKGDRINAHATFTLDRHLYNVKGNEDSVSQLLNITVNVNY